MHVDTDLSAYLDGELGPADRGRVDAHLDTCDRCQARLSELRVTASLISALPTTRPSRSLVPHVELLRTNYGVEATRQGGWNWLRPIRSFSAVASGAFLFVFLVTAVARGGSGLGGGSPTGAFAPAGNAPAAAPAPRTASSVPVSLAPAPAAEFAAQATAAPKVAGQASTPTPQPRVEPQSSPDAPAARSTRDGAPDPSPLTDPFLWLGLAVIAAVAAIATHWRLRTI